jgi:hypothetical protein
VLFAAGLTQCGDRCGTLDAKRSARRTAPSSESMSVSVLRQASKHDVDIQRWQSELELCEQASIPEDRVGVARTAELVIERVPNWNRHRGEPSLDPIGETTAAARTHIRPPADLRLRRPRAICLEGILPPIGRGATSSSASQRPGLQGFATAPLPHATTAWARGAEVPRCRSAERCRLGRERSSWVARRARTAERKIVGGVEQPTPEAELEAVM